MIFKYTINQLFKFHFHLGFSKNYFYSTLKDFIYCIRADYFVIDISKSFLNFRFSLWFCLYIAVLGSKILFVYNKIDVFGYYISLFSKVLNQFSLKTKWRVGTLTNFKRIRKFYRKIYNKFSNKKRISFFSNSSDRVLAPLVKEYIYIATLPSFLVIFNVFENCYASYESFQIQIPSVGFINNNQMPNGLLYPVMLSDSSILSQICLFSVYKNILLKSLFLRRLDFFQVNLFYKNYTYSKIRKLHNNLLIDFYYDVRQHFKNVSYNFLLSCFFKTYRLMKKFYLKRKKPLFFELKIGLLKSTNIPTYRRKGLSKKLKKFIFNNYFNLHSKTKTFFKYPYSVTNSFYGFDFKDKVHSFLSFEYLMHKILFFFIKKKRILNSKYKRFSSVFFFKYDFVDFYFFKKYSVKKNYRMLRFLRFKKRFKNYKHKFKSLKRK